MRPGGRRARAVIVGERIGRPAGRLQQHAAIVERLDEIRRAASAAP